MLELEQYIRQAAAARGIDPDVAVRVAKSEGGLKDPVRQSDFRKNGVREPSYGPFQLLVGGDGTGFPEGMGNAALAAGIDPRDPANAYRSIDFALDNAAKNGWGPWYGAKAQGITGMHGIGGAQSAAPEFTGPLPPDQIPVPAEGFGQLSAPMQSGGVDPRRFGLLDTPFTPQSILGGAPDQTMTAGILPDPSTPVDVARYAASGEPKTLGDRLSGVFAELAKTPNAPAVRFGPMGDARQTGGALLKALNASPLSDLFIQQRYRG